MFLGLCLFINWLLLNNCISTKIKYNNTFARKFHFLHKSNGINLAKKSLIVPEKNYLGFNIFKNEIQPRYENLQLYLSNNDSDCFSGSFAYNGTCLYVSSAEQKLTWFEAEKLCREMPFNTTFLYLQNSHQVEFLRKKIIQLKEKESPTDQLVFLIGFHKIANEWKWITNLPIDSENLKIENDWSVSNYTLGDCGSLALTKNLKLILKSSPCKTTTSRFICQYNLNPCFNNNACGKHGKCVNLYQTFYCDCEQVSIFYTGKYCEKLNSKAIQTILAIILITFLFVYILLASKQCKKCYRYLLLKLRTKLTKKTRQKSKEDEEESKSKTNSSPNNKPLMSRTSSVARPLRSVSKIVRSRFKKFADLFDSSTYGYPLLLLLILVLTVAQIILIDYDNPDFLHYKQTAKNNTFLISYLCDKLETYFYYEEIFYLPFSAVFFILLIFTVKKRRFTFYITKKFKKFPHFLEPTLKKTKEKSSFKEKFFSFFCCIPKKFKSCLILPNFSFSTSNRLQTAAVFILYTYDVLNIFTFIYTSTINPTLAPFSTKISGVLIDFLTQILQVLFIGFKFYPILLVADCEPGAVIYFLTTCYILIIWSVRFSNKAFCSRRKILVQETLLHFTTQINLKIKQNLQLSYNVSNIILGIFSDDANPIEKYSSLLINKIPKLFKETFEQRKDFYNDANKLKIKRAFYDQTNLNMSKNETLFKINKLINKSFLTTIFDNWLNLLENLPFYLTISYLFTRYGLLFLACFIDRLKELYLKRRLKKERESERVLDGENLESVKNLNLLIDTTMTARNNERMVKKRSKALKQVSDEVKAKDLLAQKLYKIENYNYNYIRNLLINNNTGFNWSTNNNNNNKKIIEKSFLLNLIDTYIYKSRPYLKFSKQFVNTYTVSFMIVYFFTIFGFKISHVLNALMVEGLKLFRQYVYGVVNVDEARSTIHETRFNFGTELKFTIVLTSLITVMQLLLSVKSFQRDLIKLHKAEFVFARLLVNFDLKKYVEIIKRRNKMSYSITSDSIHFTGYLIAHLIYGYLILFCGFFLLVMCVKCAFTFPNFIYSLSQIFLPIIVMIVLKLILVEFVTKVVFLKNNNYRLRNSNAYNTCTYFNFFFDCFLGLLSCMSRVWLTSFVSLLTLIRLDISMFNKENDFIMRRLDKGYLAYINYVRMEHWYNNPVVNGFCEMLVECMLHSKIHRQKLGSKMSSKNTLKFAYECNEHIFRGEQFKLSRVCFNYVSYLRLRNIFFLCVLLRRFNFLRQHRHHRIEMMRKRSFRSGTTESFFDSFDRQKRKFNKRRRGSTVAKTESFVFSNFENYLNIESNLKKMMATTEI